MVVGMNHSVFSSDENLVIKGPMTQVQVGRLELQPVRESLALGFRPIQSGFLIERTGVKAKFLRGRIGGTMKTKTPLLILFEKTMTIPSPMLPATMWKIGLSTRVLVGWGGRSGETRM